MRTVVIEIDAGFFDFAQAAIKSFARYNPGWGFTVGDLGLTAAQVDELSSFANVVKLEPLAQQAYIVSRYGILAELCSAGHELIYGLDADTLTFGSVEPVAQQLLQTNAHVALRPTAYEVGSRLGNIATVGRFFQRPAKWYTKLGHNGGSKILRPAPQLLKVVERTHELLRDHPGLFWSCDSTFVAALYDAGVNILRMPNCYNYQVTAERGASITCFDPPLDKTHTPIVVAHMLGHKSRVLSMDGSYYPIGWWWRKHLERYRREPWPTT